jgi:threonine/homoserine/homoserine lactone efflux protein
MQELTAFLGIAAAIGIGAASPGPSFVMVARTAVAASRADGLSAALGMGIGGLLFACLSLLGLHSLLLAVPTLYAALKIAGGLYLAYLGIMIWRGARTALALDAMAAAARPHSMRRSLALGLTTQVSNPKTAIWYASVFAALMPAAPTLAFDVGVAALIFLIEAGWYAVVALALSSERSRGVYLRSKSWIDRVAGTIMIALGLRLLASARP